MTVQLLHGDCRDVLAAMPDCSVDSVVTDPPYELGFMGKAWDSVGVAYDVRLWAEVLRVLKPGGHLLAFGGTRTYHRMACAIEDAGFECRDSIHWTFGSGFPKSLDVSKAIDKVNGEPNRLLRFTLWFRTTGLTVKQVTTWLRDAGLITENGTMAGHYFAKAHAGQPAIPTAAMWEVIRPHVADVPEWVDELVARIEAEREVVGTRDVPVGHAFAGPVYGGDSSSAEVNITAPATDAARQWDGWGTALKPAHEPVVVARKPLVGTVAANVLEYGTGALNIDGCRVAATDKAKFPAAGYTRHDTDASYEFAGDPNFRTTGVDRSPNGRWPANLVLTHAAECEQVGMTVVQNGVGGPKSKGRGAGVPGDSVGPSKGVSRSIGDDKGRETVPVWACAEGCPVAELDGQSGVSKSNDPGTTHVQAEGWGHSAERRNHGYAGDTGGASRFFTVTEWDPIADVAPFRYVAKPSKKERNAGLDGLPEQASASAVGMGKVTAKNWGDVDEVVYERKTAHANHHPTVKPLALMRWLVRLVTPPGGTVLDPFAGSGTTLVAATLEGFDAIGVEMTDDYLPIIDGRVAWAEAEVANRPEPGATLFDEAQP